MKKYIMFVNNSGLYSNSSKNVFTKEEVLQELKDWSDNDVITVNEKELTVEELFDDCLEFTNEVYCENMVEYGDDWVNLGIFEINE